jgi:hypothetical protein
MMQFAYTKYLDQYRTEYRRNLRLGPLFSEGFRSTAYGP